MGSQEKVAMKRVLCSLLVVGVASVASATPARTYDPAKEKAKGATLEVFTSDRTQKMQVLAKKATVGGIPGKIRVSGVATGGGELDFWLSIFRFMRPDGTTNHVAGANVAILTRPGMTALQSATELVNKFRTYGRPYATTVTRSGSSAIITIWYRENERPR
jgi:hypothetical protein